MAYLISNIPYTKVWIRKEFTHGHQKYHGEFVHGLAVAVTTMPDRCLSFQIIFTGCETDGTEEEKLRKCISGELRNQSLAWMLDGFMFYFSLIVIPFFLFYLYFYYKWLRKNYFNKI